MVSEEERGNDRQHVFFFSRGKKKGAGGFLPFFTCVCLKTKKYR